MTDAPTSLSPLVRQMLRMVQNDEPTVEEAAVRLVSCAELLLWLVDAHRLRSDQIDRNFLRKWATLLSRPEPRSEADHRPGVAQYSNDTVLQSSTRFFVTAQDTTLDHYFRRIRNNVSQDEFGLQVPGLEGASWTAFSRYRRLVAPILARLGPRASRFNCFLGDYARTPFGVHFDPHHLHSFQYVVHGTKTLRAWRPSDLVRRLGEAAAVAILRNPTKAHEMLPRAPDLVGRPGALIYWPGRYVHCLEAVGPSAGLGVIFDSKAASLEAALQAELGRLNLPTRKAGHDRPRHARPGSTVGLERDREWVSAQVASSEFWRTVAHAELLERSRLGSYAYPELRETEELRDRDRLEPRDSASPRIVYRHFEGVTLLGVNGHGAKAKWKSLRSQRDITRFLAFVNQTSGFRVGDVLKRFSRGSSQGSAFLSSLLTFFVAAGAFDRLPTEAHP